jgi:hypothetical protein
MSLPIIYIFGDAMRTLAHTHVCVEDPFSMQYFVLYYVCARTRSIYVSLVGDMLYHLHFGEWVGYGVIWAVNFEK